MNILALNNLISWLFGWLFTKSTSVSSPTPVQEPGDVYRTIYELPLKNFIQLMVHEDITALIKSGSPSWQLLLAAKKEIIDDYESKWLNADEYIIKAMLQDYTDPNLKSRYLKGMDALIDDTTPDFSALRQALKINGKEMLNRSLFTSLKFDKEDPEQFAEDFEYARLRLKHLDGFTDATSFWRTSIATKNKTGEYTNQYFDSLLSIIFGFSLLKINSEMTVQQFCDCSAAFTSFTTTIHSALYPHENTKPSIKR